MAILIDLGFLQFQNSCFIPLKILNIFCCNVYLVQNRKNYKTLTNCSFSFSYSCRYVLKSKNIPAQYTYKKDAKVTSQTISEIKIDVYISFKQSLAIFSFNQAIMMMLFQISDVILHWILCIYKVLSTILHFKSTNMINNYQFWR